MNKFRILLIGKGIWGSNWYKTLFKKGIEFAVVDKVLKNQIDDHGIVNYDSVERAFDRQLFTHAVIATPSENHLEIFNKLTTIIPDENILIEKPCGTSIKEFENNFGFFPGYLFLYSEPYKFIKENLNDIGDTIMYRSTRASMGPQPRTDISVVADYLIHDLYIFADLFGFDNIDIINTYPQKHFIHANKYDTVSVQLKRQRIFADMFSSWWYPYKQREVIISGTDGTFLWINDTLRFVKNSSRRTQNVDRYGNFRYDLFHSDAKDIILTEKMTLDCELDFFLSGQSSIIRPTSVWRLIDKIENPPYKI